MADPCSAEEHNQVIDAVRQARDEPASCRAPLRSDDPVAVEWLERVERPARRSLLDIAAIAPPDSCRIGSFLEAARAEKSDVTLQAGCIDLRPGEACGPEHLDDRAVSSAGSA